MKVQRRKRYQPPRFTRRSLCEALLRTYCKCRCFLLVRKHSFELRGILFYEKSIHEQISQKHGYVRIELLDLGARFTVKIEPRRSASIQPTTTPLKFSRSQIYEITACRAHAERLLAVFEQLGSAWQRCYLTHEKR